MNKDYIWLVIGLIGQCIFSARFIVQWNRLDGHSLCDVEAETAHEQAGQQTTRHPSYPESVDDRDGGRSKEAR